MGGMACAARLAVKRHDVTIVEQSSTYGGKLGTFERDGFVFDTGPSLVTLPAVYRDLFLKTGGALEESIDLVDLEPAFGYRFPDGTTVDMPGVDFSACARALGDAHNGYRAFSAKAIRGITIRQARMAHATEIRMRARRLEVVEVPVTILYTDETRRKGQSSLGSVHILRDLFLRFLFGGS